ncbi:MAG: Cohesin domain protein [Firmicutes bacterium ADurb.Bin419]|nr:MAG: Cohesin domain protein [Firmicutes bacterium ADurb.Bin419]
MMVKISLCIIIACVVCFGNISLLAATQHVISAGSATGYCGDKINIDVTLERPQSIAGIQFSLKYDPNNLIIEEKDITIGEALIGNIAVSSVLHC